eukprot:139545_1
MSHFDSPRPLCFEAEKDVVRCMRKTECMKTDGGSLRDCLDIASKGADICFLPRRTLWTCQSGQVNPKNRLTPYRGPRRAPPTNSAFDVLDEVE